MASNEAAYLVDSKGSSLVVKSAQYPTLRDDDIVVRSRSVAINPADWVKQRDTTNLLFGWVKHPFVLGSDVAGEIVEIGKAVTRFKIGDRVVGHCVGIDEKINSSAEGAFQLYTVLRSHMASPIPDFMSYETACVIPLGLSTAAAGLFQKDMLALQYPSQSPESTGKTVIIWGGSTSVGVNAIQLAVASGYKVVTTCSPRNFALVKSLGASHAFDYNSPTAVVDIIRVLKDGTTAGALSIGTGAAEACMDILQQTKGDKFVAMATYPMLNPPPKHFPTLQSAFNFVSWVALNTAKSKWRGIGTKFIFSTSVASNDVGTAVYVDYLPAALEKKTFLPAPEPMVVGKGLKVLQEALDIHRKGVSAKKVVVSL